MIEGSLVDSLHRKGLGQEPGRRDLPQGQQGLVCLVCFVYLVYLVRS